MASKTVIGALLIVILAASIAVTMNDVRIKATSSSTTFYVFQNGSWLTGGVESNQLYNGSKSISRGLTSLNSMPTGGEYKIIRTATYGKATVIDTYLFDGTVTNKELFPIYHTIQILNGQGLTYQYTAGSLQYSGPNLKNVPSPQSFGRNMKITFQDGWTSNTLTKLTSGGSLKVKYAVTSNNQVFNIRMFDPWWSLGNSYTYEQMIPDASYPDSGGRLTDGIAVNNWDCGGGLHTCHIGFQTPTSGQNYSVNTTIVMDLNTTITIDNIAINVWAWTGANGFNMPHNVTVYGSSDKSAWTSMGLMNVPAATADSINMTSNYTSTSYRYLAFQILGHVDQWMVLDEIYVNGALPTANEAPQWSNNQSSTPATYSPSTASTFNITWVNGTVNSLDTVLIEGNWSGTATNYTVGTATNYTVGTFNTLNHFNNSATIISTFLIGESTSNNVTYYVNLPKNSSTFNGTLTIMPTNITQWVVNNTWSTGTPGGCGNSVVCSSDMVDILGDGVLDIAHESTGIYSWNGTSWYLNTTLSNGYNDGPGCSGLSHVAVGYFDGHWNMIKTNLWVNGGTHLNCTYSWNGTGWSINNTLWNGFTGLTNDGNYGITHMALFDMTKPGEYKDLIVSGYDAYPIGLTWNGTGWSNNATLVSGSTCIVMEPVKNITGGNEWMSIGTTSPGGYINSCGLLFDGTGWNSNTTATVFDPTTQSHKPTIVLFNGMWLHYRASSGGGNYISTFWLNQAPTETTIYVGDKAMYYKAGALASTDSATGPAPFSNFSNAVSSCSAKADGTCDIPVKFYSSKPSKLNVTFFNMTFITPPFQYSNILPAGHWYWKSYANDSSGSWNATPSWFFDIGQAPNPLTLVLNNSGNMSCTYPCVSNASGNGNLTVANLYRNGTLKNSENKAAIQLAGGTHVYIFNTTGNQNYTANSTSLWLTVNQYTTTLSIWVNGMAGDQTRDSGILNITAALDAVKSLLLYRNGTLLQTSTTPLINISTWGTAGLFNVTAWFAGDENYTSAISSLNLHIDVINASISLPPSTRFRINATSDTGNFTPFNQTSVMPIFNVTNTGIAAINVSMKLNASLPSCMATSLVSTNSTFEWPGVNITDADYNVTGTTWVQVISNLGVNQSQGIWTQVEYNSCPVGTTYTFNRQWNVTRAV